MGPFPEEGSASHAQYFTKGVKANSCDLVTFPTAFSLYNRSDYKRCVCDSWFMDEKDCIMGSPSEKEQLPTTADGQADQQPKQKKGADEKLAQTDAEQQRGQKKQPVSTQKPQLQGGASESSSKATVHQSDMPKGSHPQKLAFKK
mmetsp:Transcript_12380/g.15792  ORF Transcript_12380/g.15792 Transcript_12380/m.15792 type:complete len:145 (+) Transcript_12380:1033-1467(+)